MRTGITNPTTTSGYSSGCNVPKSATVKPISTPGSIYTRAGVTYGGCNSPMSTAGITSKIDK